jgi:hypothetical protein
VNRNNRSISPIFLGFITALLCVYVVSTVERDNSSTDQKETVMFAESDTINGYFGEEAGLVTFNYGEYRGHLVRLVVENDKNVFLEIVYRKIENILGPDQSDLDYLRTQIEKASATNVVLKNGMKMRIEGYPIWGPYSHLSQNRNSKRLSFGENVTFQDSTIIVHGIPTRPDGYYPYALPTTI